MRSFIRFCKACVLWCVTWLIYFWAIVINIMNRFGNSTLWAWNHVKFKDACKWMDRVLDTLYPVES